MSPIHNDLASGRWHELTLAEQMGNIGSEVSRARLSQGKNAMGFEGAVARALELFDLTAHDPRWHGGQREILRAREVFCDATLGGHEYGSSLADLESYFDEFALAARKNK